MYLNFLNADLDLGFKFIETAKLAGSDSAVGLVHFAVSLLVEDTVRIQGWSGYSPDFSVRRVAHSPIEE